MTTNQPGEPGQPVNYVITHIPNTERGRAATKLLKAPKYHHKRRGRGARSKAHYQDLPLERATHYSLYGYTTSTEYSWCYNRDYYQFRGYKGEKPVIRLTQSVRYG